VDQLVKGSKKRRSWRGRTKARLHELLSEFKINTE
jgi:hypothetical protein